MLDVSTRSLLTEERPGALGTLVGSLLRRVYALTGRARYDDFRFERVLGMPIVVLPTVANPKVLRTGAFFASRIDARLIGANAEVLDMERAPASVRFSPRASRGASSPSTSIPQPFAARASMRSSMVSTLASTFAKAIYSRPWRTNVSTSCSSIHRSCWALPWTIAMRRGVRATSRSASPPGSPLVSSPAAWHSCCFRPSVLPAHNSNRNSARADFVSRSSRANGSSTKR